jgi:hypothetical protein
LRYFININRRLVPEDQTKEFEICGRQKRKTYKTSFGSRGGNRPLGRPRIRWEDNNMMGLQEI